MLNCSISSDHDLTMEIQYNLFITRFIIADIKYTTTSTGVGYGSGFELTKDTPYLALTGELWDVFCEYFDEKRSCYKGVLLYQSLASIDMVIHA